MNLYTQGMEDGSVMLLQRHIDNIPFVANSLETSPAIRLRPNLVKNICLHVEVNFTPTAAAVILQAQDAPWNMIDRITVRSVRNEILKTVDSRTLRMMNFYETGTDQFTTFPVPIVIGPAVIASFDLDIPFDDITGIHPENTILNLNEYTEIYIDILWNDAATVMYSMPITINSVITTFVVKEREPVDMRDELTPRMKLVDQSYRQLVDSNQWEFLLPENTLIKTLGVLLTDDTGNRIGPAPGPAGPADPIARLSIEDDDNAHSLREWSGGQIRSQNKSYYGIENVPDGWYAIEFDQLHDFSTLYKTFGINYPKIKLEFDNAAMPIGTSNVTLFIRQVATPPKIAVPI